MGILSSGALFGIIMQEQPPGEVELLGSVEWSATPIAWWGKPVHKIKSRTMGFSLSQSTIISSCSVRIGFNQWEVFPLLALPHGEMDQRDSLPLQHLAQST